jgi:hypothetical protein
MRKFAPVQTRKQVKKLSRIFGCRVTTGQGNEKIQESGEGGNEEEAVSVASWRASTQEEEEIVEGRGKRLPSADNSILPETPNQHHTTHDDQNTVHLAEYPHDHRPRGDTCSRLLNHRILCGSINKPR